MSSSKRTRALGVVAILLVTQLSACIVVPVPVHRSRAVVVEPGGGHYGPPPPPRHRRY